MRRVLPLLVLLLALVGSWFAFEGLSAPEPRAAVTAGPGRPAPTELEGEETTSELEQRDAPEGAQRTEIEQASIEGDPERVPTATPEQADPGVLIATLVDEAGAPIVGGELRWPRRDNIEPAVSDEAGVARLELPGQYLTRWRGQDYATSFEIVAAGFATHRFRSTIPAGEETDVGEILLHPGGALVGRVVNEQGQGLVAEVTTDAPALGRTAKEARLRGPMASEEGRPSAESSTEGSYRLEGLPAGPLRLWARGPSGAWGFSEPITVVAGVDTHVSDLVIRAIDASEAFQGIVVGPDGAPVPKALVVGSAHVQGPISSVRTEADEGGRFTLVAMSDRPHLLKAYDATKTLRPTMMPSVEPGATDLEIRLETRRFIEVHVVDDATGDPVEKPWVALEPQGNTLWIGGVPRLEPETLRPGVIRLSVPQETFQVAASAPGYDHHYGDGPLEPESAPATIEVRLTAQPMLRGRVLADGEPVEGAWVEVSQRMGPKFPILVQGFRTRLFNGGRGQETTDAEGRFEVPIAEQSDFSQGLHLVAGKDGWATTEEAVDAEPSSEIELTLTRGGAIEGTVLMPDGVSAQGTVVAASNGNGRVVETRVDENDEYRLEHLAPGPWELKHLEESSEMTMSVAQTPQPEQYQGDCEVRLGQTTKYDLDQRGSRTDFEGTLTIDGLPATGWSAVLQPGAVWGYERSGPATLIDAKGSFSLSITAEKAKLVLEHSTDGDHRSLSREYELNGELQTPEVALLTGRIEGTTQPEAQVSVIHERPDGFQFEATTKADALGAFSFEGVPEGSSNLRKRHFENGWTGWTAGPAVTVVAGRSSDAKF